MHKNWLRRLHLELLHALGQTAVLVIALVIRHLADEAALPELPARHPDGLLDLCLFQLGQPLLLQLQAGLVHLAPEIVAPAQKRLGRDGGALELLVLLALGRHDGLLAAALDGGLAVGNELLGGVLEGGVQREDHGDAEVLLDRLAEGRQQRRLVVGDGEVRVRRAGLLLRVEVEKGGLVGVGLGVADVEEHGRGFGGVLLADDVEDDLYPEFRLGDVCRTRRGGRVSTCHYLRGLAPAAQPRPWSSCGVACCGLEKRGRRPWVVMAG
ncbi:hypothetical protein VDGD_22012 [Verticillium dahliae]|nr:hypothetical protein VDGD_22012 [Verticillium dahliae]